MNKEKKLTDEEIVKAYEYCVVQHRDCDGCPYDGWGCPIKGRDVVEAFYRLQDEKQKVVQDYYSERQTCDEQKDIIAKLKAEIERLTERERFLKNAWKTSLETTKTVEIGRKASEARNAELQKQVDELKVYLASEKVCSKQAVKDTAKEICDLILEHWEKKQFVECDWLRIAIAEKYGVEVE